MKFTKLLVLGAMLASVSNAFAVLIDREEPTAPASYTVDETMFEKTPVEFAAGDVYVLYNVGTEKYFIAGSDWNTRAIVSENAAFVRFTLTDAAVAKGEGVYELKNYVADKKEVRSAFFDGTNIWTDNNTETNRFWKVQGTKEAYQILNIADAAAGKVLGWDGADTAGRLFMVDPATAGDNANWQLFALPEWTTYYRAKDAYDAAEELRAVLEKDAPDGLDVAEYEAVYNNLDATAAEIKAAIEKLKKAIKEFAMTEINNATGEKPVDITTFITNPSYENNTNEGWQGTAPAFNSNAAEFYNKNYNYYQDVTDVPVGVYAVDVQAFYRAGSTDSAYVAWSRGDKKYGALYAKGLAEADSLIHPLANLFDGASDKKLGTDDSQKGNYYVPFRMWDFAKYAAAGKYHNTLFFDVLEGSSLRIGLAKTQQLNTDWTIFTNWTLKYYGKGTDAYKAWAQSAAGLFSFDSYTYYTKALKDEYDALIASANATNRDEAQAFIAKVQEAIPAYQENVKVWAVYADSVEIARALVAQLGSDANDAVKALNTYLTNARTGAGRILSAGTLTTEEVKAEINKLYDLYKAAQLGEVSAGTDVTYRLTNPDFASGDWTGWTKTNASGGNVAVSNSCAEAWNNASFDIHQEVSQMPVGVYEISVQGFYRYLRGDNAWNAYNQGTSDYVKNAPTYIYMNANTTSFRNVYGEEKQITDEDFYKSGSSDYAVQTDDAGTKYYFPNGMASAAIAFAADMYQNSAYGAVVNAADTMLLGVKGSSNQGGDSWVIFDNFKLTYWAKQADKVLKAMEGAIAEVEGLLEDTDLSETLKVNLSKALEDAKKAQTEQAEDGDALFAALTQLYDAKNGVAESKAKYAELRNKLTDVANAIQKYESDDVLQFVAQSYLAKTDEISDKLANSQIEIEEIEGYMKQLDKMLAEFNKYIELADILAELQAEVNAVEGDNDYLTWSIDASELLDEIYADLGEDLGIAPDQIENRIIDVKAMLSAKNMTESLEIAMASASDENPVDATQLIQNPNFSALNEDGELAASQAGWKGTNGAWGETGQEKAMALEFYNTTFDKYQELYGIPEGVYELRVQAFQRAGNADADLKAFKEGKKSNAFLYGISGLVEQDTISSAIQVHLASVYGTTDTIKVETDSVPTSPGRVRWAYTYADENNKVKADSLLLPDQPMTAVAYFDTEVDGVKRYTNSLIVKVSDGSLRFGVKKTIKIDGDWFMMDNWKLIYYGEESTKQVGEDLLTGIETVAGETEQVLRTEFFNMNGVRVLAPQKGITIMRQTLSNGNVIVKKLNLK